MNTHSSLDLAIEPDITVEICESLTDEDLALLSELTEETVIAEGGFGWMKPPPRHMIDRYWNGVMAIPQRHLIIARLDGVLCGAIQLIEPSGHNQAHHFSATLISCFVAKWARGHKIGEDLFQTAENYALEKGYALLKLDVRETQKTAIKLIERLGYERWAENPHYAATETEMIKGFYYQKQIAPFTFAGKPDLKIA